MGLEVIPLEYACLTQMNHQAEEPALPRRVEDQLAVRPRQRGLAVQRVEVRKVRCERDGHDGVPAVTSAVPTIESRLMSGTSSSAVSPSVSAGRCGMTR